MSDQTREKISLASGIGRWVAGTLLVILLATAAQSLFPAPILAQLTELTITPSSGAPGTTVTIAGSFFESLSRISITIDGVPLVTANVTRGGSFSVKAVVPMLTPGEKRVTADGPFTTFVVLEPPAPVVPNIAVTPPFGLPGANFTVRGSGFPRSSSVSVTDLPVPPPAIDHISVTEQNPGVSRTIGAESSPPLAPTNVVATRGTNTAYVTVSWTASASATNYRILRDSTDLGLVGNVTVYRDTGADIPTITAGTTAASDGTSTTSVVLSVAGQSANNGTTHTYRVQAYNLAGYSSNSSSTTGYRGIGVWTGDTGENQCYGNVHINGYIYAAGYGCSPAKVFKINASTMEHTGTWTASVGTNRAVKITGSGNYVYVAIHNDAGAAIPKFIKINTTTMLDEATFTGVAGQSYGRNICMDADYVYGLSEYASFGAANINKLNIADLSEAGIWRGNGEAFTGIAVDDTYVYAVTYDTPFKLYIIRKSDMALFRTYTGTSGQNYGRTVFADSSNIFVTLGSTTLLGTIVKVIKIAKSTWTQAGIYEGKTGETDAFETASDGDFLYSALQVQPAKIIKINYVSMAEENTYTAPPGFNLGTDITYAEGRLYTTFNTSPARMKVIDAVTLTDLSYQWQRSATDNPASAYSDIPGAVTSSYSVTDGVAQSSGRYYRCIISAVGATPRNTPDVFATVKPAATPAPTSAKPTATATPTPTTPTPAPTLKPTPTVTVPRVSVPTVTPAPTPGPPTAGPNWSLISSIIGGAIILIIIVLLIIWRMRKD